jgi:hypothetical protein
MLFNFIFIHDNDEINILKYYSMFYCNLKQVKTLYTKYIEQ